MNSHGVFTFLEVTIGVKCIGLGRLTELLLLLYKGRGYKDTAEQKTSQSASRR